MRLTNIKIQNASNKYKQKNNNNYKYPTIMEENLKILLCEDDENLGMLLREYLQAKGYTAELCPDGEAGYKAFMKTKFDICVSHWLRRFARPMPKSLSSSSQPRL